MRLFKIGLRASSMDANMNWGLQVCKRKQENNRILELNCTYIFCIEVIRVNMN